MDVLLDASAPIPLHALAAMLAIIIGAVQLAAKKGGTQHRLLGRIWVGLMLIVALSSFFIYELRLWGRYSPIHLLSIWVLISVSMAVYYARAGNIKRHAQIMKSLYVFALIVTGFFTLLPGRIMYQLVFGA